MAKLSQLDKLPPHDSAAERAVISLLIRFNDRMNDVCDIIHADDFFEAKYQTVFKTIAKLYAESHPFDPVSLRTQLLDDGALQSIGGVLGLSEMMDDVSVSSNIRYYAETVAEKSRLRKLISTATETIQSAYDGESDSKAILEAVDSKLSEIAGQRAGECTSASEIVRGSYDYIADIYKHGRSGIKTGIEQYDKMTGGFHPGELVVIAGRPAMGKTSYGMNVAENIAQSTGKHSLVFSLEMSKNVLGLRLISSKTLIPLTDLMRGNIYPEQWEFIQDALKAVDEYAMHVIDRGEMSILELRANARRYARQHEIGIILIDYIQLMSGNGKSENRNNEIGQISRGLKALAKELKCPVVALSQLNRAVEGRGGKRRPQLSDLRESGNIEQDADLVLMLYRPEYYGEVSVEIDGRQYPAENMAEGIIAKHRNGPTGSFWMRFDKIITKFGNLDWRA